MCICHVNKAHLNLNLREKTEKKRKKGLISDVVFSSSLVLSSHYKPIAILKSFRVYFLSFKSFSGNQSLCYSDLNTSVQRSSSADEEEETGLVLAH